MAPQEIYVRSPEEAVDVWRPVIAVHAGGNAYRIVEQHYDIDIERWEFEPGDEVVCEWRTFEGGERALAAVLRIDRKGPE